MKLADIIKIVVGILFTGLGLYIFFKDVELAQLTNELKSTDPLALLGSCAMVVLTLYLRALRWRLILPETKGTTKKYLFSNVSIGFMINNLLPARIGEIARSFILWRKNNYPLTISIGTIILERIIDTAVLLCLFVIPIILLPQCQHLYLFAIFASLFIMACIILGILYVQCNPLMTRLGRWVLMRIPKKYQRRVEKLSIELTSNLGWLHNPKQTLWVIVLSILTILCYPLMIIFLANSAGATFGLLEGMFGQAFAAFGAAIPLAPGYVGTLHAVMLQGLTIIGMDGDKARALVIIYHAINYILITILGIFCLFRINLSFEDLFSAKKSMRK